MTPRDPHTPEIRFLERHLATLRGARVLDVGAGTGAFVASLDAAGATAQGLDLFAAPGVQAGTFPVTLDEVGWWDLVCFREVLYYLPQEATGRWVRDHAGAVYVKSLNPAGTGDWGGRTRSPYPGDGFTVPAVLGWLARYGFRYVDDVAPRGPGWRGAVAWPWQAWAGTTERYGLLAERR